MGNACGGRKETRLVLIGLDLAGKTSILNRLRFNEAGATTPTVGFNFETVAFKNCDINIWDTGGQDKIRDLWRHYYEEVDGILFVIDSTDQGRIDEAKEALHKAMRDINLKDAFLCVLANKRDLTEQCMSVDEIRNRLQLTSFPETRIWTLLEVSAVKGTGLEEVLTWISSKHRK
uniref:ADP-ribosylation factor 6-like n=1 Tax=Ciona intestinalis TaxID=7719 RepID=F6XBW4_CIOIN|nr:ADP-ribosylation factor 6-like [Ciona intestinalis]|eukprot:XP_009862219.1 ADP-ribosylation factor 6-like [Ciona intestinalis]